MPYTILAFLFGNLMVSDQYMLEYFCANSFNDQRNFCVRAENQRKKTLVLVSKTEL